MKLIILLSIFLNTKLVLAQTLSCSAVGEKPLTLKGQVCCPGTKLNSATNICEDLVTDPGLVACSSDLTCEKGKGCMVQREEHLFNNTTPTTQSELDALNASQDQLESVQGSLGEEELPLGATCTASAQCESYFCSNRKCMEKKVCRFADEEDTQVSASVLCDQGLVKNAQGLCDYAEADKKSIYIGLLDKVDIQGNKSWTQGQCHFELDSDATQKSLVAMKTLRALEWHFATSGLPDSQECLRALPQVRDQIGKALRDGRKLILKNFNIVMAQIDQDYQTLKNASDKSDAIVEYDGFRVPEKDLATRRPSGYDGLRIMYRRNLAFQSYEKAMSSLIQEISGKISTLSKNMSGEIDRTNNKRKGWNHKNKNWTVNDAVVESSGFSCRGGSKKRIKRRWDHYLRVKGNIPGITDILDPANKEKYRENVANYLRLMSGDADNVTSTQDFRSGPSGSFLKNYYLLDAMMPGGTTMNSGKNGGSDVASLSDLWTQFNTHIKAYFRDLRDANASGSFIYEPELIAITQQACFEGVSAGTDCSKVEEFVSEVTDIGFAQFLAYGISPRRDYKKFFDRSSTWRRRLLAKLETDTQNIVKFYEAMEQKREYQTQCLASALNSMVDQGIVVAGVDGVGTDAKSKDSSTPTTSGSNGGVASLGVTTSTSNAIGTSAGSASVNGSNPSSSASAVSSSGTDAESLRVSASSKLKYLFDLGSGSFSSLNQTSTLGSIGSKVQSSTGSVSASNSASAAISARYSEMKAANQASLATPQSVAVKESNTSSALAALGKGSGVVASSGSSKGSSSSSAGGTSILGTVDASKNLLAPATPKGDVANEIQVEQKTIKTSGSAAGISEGNISEGLPPISEGIVNSAPEQAISNEEQDAVLANYERTKGDYQSSNEDELFSKVSKAYVRNLEKVLKKKKLDD